MDLSLEFPLSSNMVNSCVYDLETKDIPFSRRSFESSFHVRMQCIYMHNHGIIIPPFPSMDKGCRYEQ